MEVVMKLGCNLKGFDSGDLGQVYTSILFPIAPLKKLGDDLCRWSTLSWTVTLLDVTIIQVIPKSFMESNLQWHHVQYVWILKAKNITA